MSVEIFHHETIQAEQEARRERKKALQEAFREIIKLIVNTGKYPKAKAAMDIVIALVDPSIHFENGRVLQLPSTQDEPLLPEAAAVATYKAELARINYLENQFPDLIFLLQQLNLALKANLDDGLIQELLKGIIFVGGDINAFIANPVTGELQQHHKLERDLPILDEMTYMKIRDKLYQTYVYPSNGQVRVVWEISMVIINGQSHDFTDLVEVIAEPIDAELLEIYLKAALSNGMLLKSNTHLELFELLCESGKIKTVAKLPKELVDQGYGFSQLRQSPKPEELQAILRSINSNAPVYIA